MLTYEIIKIGQFNFQLILSPLSSIAILGLFGYRSYNNHEGALEMSHILLILIFLLVFWIIESIYEMNNSIFFNKTTIGLRAKFPVVFKWSEITSWQIKDEVLEIVFSKNIDSIHIKLNGSSPENDMINYLKTLSNQK